MILRAEAAVANDARQEEIATSLRAVTKLGGKVEPVSSAALPNHSRVIVDDR